MKSRSRARLAGVAAILAVAVSILIPASASAWGGYENGRIPASQLSTYRGHLLQADAANALANLNAKYVSIFGANLELNDGYRDYDSQVYWRNYWCGQGHCELAAVPGKSNHGWGTAVDFSGIARTDWGNAKYVWLKANAPAYGWVHPSWAEPGGGAPEAWHWEYVGGVSAPVAGSSRFDLNGDTRSDLLAVRNDGYLAMFIGDGSAGFGSFILGPGWGTTSAIVHGDYNGDGAGDLLQTRSDGNLYYYQGDWAGGFTPTLVGPGWSSFSLVTGGVDFTGDGKPDLVARAADTNLYAYPGNGQGGFGNPVQIGTNWSGFSGLVAGDFNKDGRGDLMARNAAGELWGYYGTPSGFGFIQKLGQGWNGFSTLTGGGDYNSDTNPDIIARRDSDQTLWLYPGNGTGGFGSGVQIGSGWGAFTHIS